MREYIPSTVSPTLHPMAELARRFRQTEYGLEAQMTPEEAVHIGGQPGKLWWEVSNYASALYLQGRTDEALEVAERALKMKRAVNTLINMAVILETQGRFEEAIEFAKEACGVDPSDDRATALFGEALLRMGRFAEGWPYYVKNRASMDWCKIFIPEWEPTISPMGKKIIVIEGGGYGDNIYFTRWLAPLRRWGAKLTILCQPSISPLYRYLDYATIDNWQGNVDINWHSYDYFLPLLSLGDKSGTTIDNYKWDGPYIPMRRGWRPIHKVGFCWKAGEALSPRKQRSLSNEQRERIVKHLPKKYRWVNMSHGYTDDTMENVKMDDWLDTAKAVAKLDVLITVDTGIAHLAGAMGVATWAVLPGAAAWQYPLGHDFHPLYPSMRMFRNPREGMDEAVDYVVAELQKY